MEENNIDITQKGLKPLKGIRGEDLTSEKKKQQKPSISDLVLAQRQGIKSNNIGYSSLDESFATPKINPNIDYGSSTYDGGLIVNADLTTVNNLRAEKQSGFTLAINGTIKGVITAGTTFVDGIVGVAYGLGLGFYNIFNHDKEQSGLEAFMEGLWNNPINKLMNDIQRGSEDIFVNYRTEEQMNLPWYSMDNLLSANFIFDTVVKNLGFTVGALYSGGLYTKGLEYLGKSMKMAKLAGLSAKSIEAGEKAARNLNRLKSAQLITGGVLSAHAEAMTEAYNTYRDMKDLKGQELLAKRALDANDAIREFISKGGVLDMLGNPDPSSNPEDAKILTDKLAAIDNAYNEANKALDLEARRAATMDGVLNIPILTLDNILTFGKLFTGSYKSLRGIKYARIKATREAERAAEKAGHTAQRKLNRIVERANAKGGKGLESLTAAERNLVEFNKDYLTGTKMGAFLTSLRAPLREGNEEMALAMASLLGLETFGKTVDDIYKLSLDGEAKENTESFFGKAIKNIIPVATKEWRDSFSKTYGDPQRWEEGFVGALTGFMGSPVFGSLARKSRGMTIGKEGVIGLNGGTFAEVSEYLKKRNTEKLLLLNATAVIRDPEATTEKLKHLVTAIKLNNIKERALILDNEKEFKDARTAEAFELIRHLDNIGRLDILEDIMENSAEFSEEDYKYIQEMVRKERSEYDPNVEQYSLAIKDIELKIKEKDEEINSFNENNKKSIQLLEALKKERSSLQESLDNYNSTAEQISLLEAEKKELLKLKRQLEKLKATGKRVNTKLSKINSKLSKVKSLLNKIKTGYDSSIHLQTSDRATRLEEAINKKESSLNELEQLLQKDKESLITSLSENLRKLKESAAYIESPYIHEDGTDYTLDEIKDTVQRQRERFKQVLDTYKSAKTEIDEATLGILTNEQLGTLTWYNVMRQDWSQRANKIVDTYKQALQDLINNPELNEALQQYDDLINSASEQLGIDPKTYKIQFGGRLDSIELQKAIKEAALRLFEELEKGGEYFALLLATPEIKIGEETLNVGDIFTKNLLTALSASLAYTGTDAEKLARAIKDLRNIGEGLRNYNKYLDMYLKNPDLMDLDKAKLEVQELKKKEKRKEEKAKEKENFDEKGDPFKGKLGALVMHLIDNGDIFANSKKLIAYKESKTKELQDRLDKAAEFYYFYDDLTSLIKNSSELSEHSKRVLLDLINKLMYECDNYLELVGKIKDLTKTEEYLDDFLPGVLGNTTTQEYEVEKEAVALNIFKWVNENIDKIVEGFPRFLELIKKQTTDKTDKEKTEKEKELEKLKLEIQEFLNKINWKDYYSEIFNKLSKFVKDHKIKISDLNPYLSKELLAILDSIKKLTMLNQYYLLRTASIITEMANGDENITAILDKIASLWNPNNTSLFKKSNSFVDVLSHFKLLLNKEKFTQEELKLLDDALLTLVLTDPNYAGINFSFLDNSKEGPAEGDGTEGTGEKEGGKTGKKGKTTTNEEDITPEKGDKIIGTSETEEGEGIADPPSVTTKEEAGKDNIDNLNSNRSNDPIPENSEKRLLTLFVRQDKEKEDTEGTTLVQYYDKHPEAIPKGVDPKAFMKLLRAIHEFLNELGAFNYVDTGNVHKGDTIYFTMDKTLNENAGVPVILMAVKDSEGKEHIIGSLYTKVDLDCIDRATGKPVREVYPLKLKFYDELVAELTLGSKKYSDITTTVNGFYGGDVLRSATNNQHKVSEINTSGPAPLAVVISTGIVSTKNVTSPLSIKNKVPGLVYYYVTAVNTGVTVPMKCTSVNLNELPKGDWYLEQMKNAVRHSLDNVTELAKAKEEILQWFPYLPNFHINYFEKNGLKYMLFGWGLDAFSTIEHTYSFNVTEGVFNEESLDKFINKIANEIIIGNGGKKIHATTNVSPALLNNEDYVNHISNYLMTNVVPGYLHTVNSGFTVDTSPMYGKKSSVIGSLFESKKTDSKSSNEGNSSETSEGTDNTSLETETPQSTSKSKNKGMKALESLLGEGFLGKAASKIGIGSTTDAKSTTTSREEKEEPPFMTTFNDMKISTQQTTLEQLEASVELIKLMIPSLSEEGRIRVVNGLIKTVDREGNPIEVYGLFKNGILYVSNQSPIGTAFHEAFHYVYSTLLDTNEQIALFKEAVNKWGNKSQIELEERLSESFRQFMLLRNDSSITGRLKRIFSTLKHIALSLIGKESLMDSIFNLIYKNKIESKQKTDKLNSRLNIASYELELKLHRINKYKYENLTLEQKEYMELRGFTLENFERLNTDLKEILLHCM